MAFSMMRFCFLVPFMLQLDSYSEMVSVRLYSKYLFYLLKVLMKWISMFCRY